MLSYLKGSLISVGDDSVEIEINGMGFNIQIPSSDIPLLPPTGKEVKILPHLILQEDKVELFGFLEEKEKLIFQRLLSVAGIGPKAALALLSSFSPAALAEIIVNEDIAQLTTVPGIGKKTAQRLVLELKEKMESEVEINSSKKTKVTAVEAEEALAALCSLGYQKSEVWPILEDFGRNQEKHSVEELILKTLKVLGK
jgi:Holliday junction DNA helicase RuvA